MLKIELTQDLPSKVEEKMREDLAQYESSHGIDVNYKRFALILTEGPNQEAIGVLNAFTAFSEIYIEDLWIDSNHRGKGYGKKLLENLEQRFKGKGFNNINLVTNQFNAPGFYEKCGFTLEFVRKNLKNPKLTKFFFVKFFEDENQTQGLIS
ncbi:MAG: GNAT family N-acetyltransferase [Proteobacteria bacterium]|nr:GNAT family N-acetyltransferase [Pseudomonadota bacterium]